jgi:Plasmid pRiA4b ORF-3-like protein
VQIKVKLLGVSKPPVWRQLQLRADTNLDHLHETLVAAFGWQDYHMHCFSSGPEEFGVPDPELGFIDERHVTLDELLDADPDTHYPVLVAAKGACPPEDCGRPWQTCAKRWRVRDLHAGLGKVYDNCQLRLSPWRAMSFRL